MPAVGRMETPPASGNAWTAGQKIAAGLGAVAGVGVGAYGAYKYYSDQKDNMSPPPEKKSKYAPKKSDFIVTAPTYKHQSILDMEEIGPRKKYARQI